MTQGLSSSAACGIFPDQGSNSCPLHWQVASQPLRHQGSQSECHRWEQLGVGENSRQRGEQEKDTRVERVDLFRCPVSIELGGSVRKYGAGK